MAPQAHAKGSHIDGAHLAIVIDDIGASHARGMQVIDLPRPVTLAVLPHTPHADELARRAHAAGQQVIVHLPMQSLGGHFLGRGGLTMRLGREQFMAKVNAALDAVPFARGANNHMGSLLTATRVQMDWLMDAIAARRNWLFLDSRTTARTVAAIAATEAGIPVVSRDVFLDNERDAGAVWQALGRAVRVARQRGYAVAIGHPHASTLSVLRRALPRLVDSGITLVPLARITRAPARLWHTGYSPDGQALRTR